MVAALEPFPPETFQGAAGAPPDARAMMVAMRAFAVVFAIVFVAAFGWLAYKFSTPAVRAEFI